MTFECKTVYDQKAVETMARALRLTVRKKHSRRSRVLGAVVFVLGLGLPFAGGFSFGFRTAVSWLAAAAVAGALLFEDKLNGRIALGRMLPGTETADAVFEEEGYSTATAAAESRWAYDRVDAVAETGDFFVLVFGVNHAQVYAKAGLTGGTAEEFREFLAEKTGKPVEKL
ncbi:MAG: YcxB family protein [Oscillospiraceae bacterium]|nr:YcxB family protein [Oscillospiraceae bacterium]